MRPDQKTLRSLAVLGLVASMLTPGCRPDPRLLGTPEPVVNPTATPVSGRVSRGRGYDIVSELVQKELVYVAIQSKAEFLTDLSAYRRIEGNNLPCSLVLADRETAIRLQIAYCDAFVPDSFSFHNNTDVGSNSIICAPATLSKRMAYRSLVDHFVNGQLAPQKMVQYLFGGASPDCSYFVDNYINERRRIPPTGAPKG